jgi:rubrerythrin
MHEDTSRDYCLTHPLEVCRLYGVGTFVGTLVGRRRSLLARVAETFHEHRTPMPGWVGRGYRIARLVELRVANIYRLLAERFADLTPVRDLFRDFEAEEIEHGHLMTVCLHTVKVDLAEAYAPSIFDPEIRALLRHLRAVQRRIPEMSLEEAFKAAEALEAGEANIVFGKLVRQVHEPEVSLLKHLLRDAEDHQESVPRRIWEVRGEVARTP